MGERKTCPTGFFRFRDEEVSRAAWEGDPEPFALCPHCIGWHKEPVVLSGTVDDPLTPKPAPSEPLHG